MALVFHKLVSVEEAIKRVEEALGGLKPRGTEMIHVLDAAGRVLAEDIYAQVAAPPFDRSTVDGYAVNARDTYGAAEGFPKTLKLVGKSDVGKLPERELGDGECMEIATGAPMPRGANAVVMVEYTKREDDNIVIYRPVVPGENVAQAGSDILEGDIILRRGQLITPREVAVLAAQGYRSVPVYKRLRAIVFSTGNELTPAGEQLEAGKIYDVNGPTVVSMLRELGVDAEFRGILPDDEQAMYRAVAEAVEQSDMVITSGSTSAGFGDMIYRIFGKIAGGGVIIHGLRLKPGKPTVIAAAGEKLLIGLPGFPLSAMMVFQTIVRPIVQRLLGASRSFEAAVKARVPFRIEAGRGKRELIPVQLVEGVSGLTAYPLLMGSGSTSALALADGYVDVDEGREFLEANEEVEIKLLAQSIRPADLVIIGSHCYGISMILDLMGISNSKVINVGSLAGWYAVKRGEADIAGTHLLDEQTGSYNLHMVKRLGLEGEVVVVRGYARRIGFLVKRGNPKQIQSFQDLLRGDIMFVNRVRGSGVRTYIDIKLRELLGRDVNAAEHVKGYYYEAKSHTAVAAAVAQGRADVGVAIEVAARQYGLDFIPLTEEIFDFVIHRERLKKPHVKLFIDTLSSKEFATTLAGRLQGYRPLAETGRIIYPDSSI